MFGRKTYHYLVDGLTDEKADLLRRSLSAIRHVQTARIDIGRSMVEIQSTRDVADQVRIACEVAGAHYRTRARL